MTNPETAWQRSSYCGSNACVEISRTPTAVLMRDSKNPDGPPLRFTPAGWGAFLERIRADEQA